MPAPATRRAVLPFPSNAQDMPRSFIGSVFALIIAHGHISPLLRLLDLIGFTAREYLWTQLLDDHVVHSKNRTMKAASLRRGEPRIKYLHYVNGVYGQHGWLAVEIRPDHVDRRVRRQG